MNNKHLFRALLSLMLCALPLGTLSAAPADTKSEGAVPPLAPGMSLPLYELEKLTDDLYAFRYSVYRDIFILTDEGVIVVDPISVTAAKILRSEIAKLTDKPVRYVAYSHSHWDHAGGGQIFKDEGAKFVAQEKCAENLRINGRPDVILPDITFKDTYTIRLGGKSLELYYYGPTHDNCLVMMVPEPANMLFVVDISNPPSGWHMPYNPTLSDDALYNMVHYLRSVEDLVARKGITTTIGGHINSVPNPANPKGRPMLVNGTLGTADIIRERREFYDGVISAVRAELAAGTPPEQVPDVLVKRGLFADKIVLYNPEMMRGLYTRITTFAVTGE